MIVLGIDLGKHTGVARAVFSDGMDAVSQPFTLHLDSKYHPERLLMLDQHLSVLLNNVDLVGFEMAFQAGQQAARVYGGYLGVLMLACVKRDIPMHHVAASTLKKWATGNGKAEKAEMIEEAERRLRDHIDPLEPRRRLTHDEADAFLVMEWVRETHGKDTP